MYSTLEDSRRADERAAAQGYEVEDWANNDLGTAVGWWTPGHDIHADDEDGVLDALDLDGDGQISVEEIHAALARILGMSTDCTQMALAKYVHRFADVNGHGEVTRDDLLRFVRDEGLFSDYEDGLRVRA